MAITLVGSITAPTPVSNANFTITEPTGTAQNDVLVVWVAHRGTVGYDAPTGWTKLLDESGGNTSTTTNSSIASGELFYIVRGASAPTLTFTKQAGTSDVAAPRCMALRGVDTAAPIRTSTITTMAANSTTAVTSTGIDGTSGDYAALFFAGADNVTISASQINDTVAISLTERADSGTNTGADTANGIASDALAVSFTAKTFQCTTTSSRHVVAAVTFKAYVPAKIGTLSENFDDNSIDTDKWNQYLLGSATIAETSQQLQITSVAATISYGTLQTKVDYDFTESNTAFRVVQPQDQHFSHENFFVSLPSTETPGDPQNYEGWYISNGFIRAIKKVAGTATFMWSEAYVAADHAWIRLRHAGTTLYFDTATSSASNPPVEADWVNKYSVTPSFDMTAKRLQIQAGGYDLAHAGDTAIFDSLHTTAAFTGRTGTLAATLGAATSSAAATVSTTGTTSRTLGAVTSSAAGAVALTGSASNTLGAATTTATGAVALSGTSSTTLSAATVSSSATAAIAGNVSKTLDAANAASSGTVASTASATNTLAAATSNATGTVAITGQSARTLDAASAESTATNAISATSSTTLGATAISATGVTGSENVGTLSQSLGAASSTASGQVSIAAQSIVTTGAASVSATATGLVSGQADSTLAATTINATGSLQTSAQTNAALSSMSASGSGQVTIAANGSVVMGAVAADAQGAATLAAILSGQLGAATVSSDGTAYTPDVPTVRIYTIEAENRVYVVAPENRLHTIAAESRSHTVEAEDRLHAVAPEDRAHTVAPENRTWEIT